MLCGKRTMGAVEGGGAFISAAMEDSSPTKRVRTALQSGFMRYGEQWANQIRQDCEMMATEQHGTSVPDAVLHTMETAAPVLEQQYGMMAAELGTDVPPGKEQEWWAWWQMKMASASSQQPPERERARHVCGF